MQRACRVITSVRVSDGEELVVRDFMCLSLADLGT